MFTIQYQVAQFIDVLGVFIPIIAILLPVFIVLIVFVYAAKSKKYKYDALIEVSKNVKDTEEISDLLRSFKEGKKSNKDLRRTGLVTLFTGIGLAALDKFGLETEVLFGVGLLVMFIGLGQMIAGYIYPNQPDEITDTVESYEKK
jgi:ABC-type transport system involved in cytochrome bd biosynthesis fused ATPase/permease subunit